MVRLTVTSRCLFEDGETLLNLPRHRKSCAKGHPGARYLDVAGAFVGESECLACLHDDLLEITGVQSVTRTCEGDVRHGRAVVDAGGLLEGESLIALHLINSACHIPQGGSQGVGRSDLYRVVRPQRGVDGSIDIGEGIGQSADALMHQGE